MNSDNLYVVIQAVSEEIKSLDGRQRYVGISALAREALVCSAKLGGITAMKFTKDERGVPQPTSGVYWSVSHADGFVAAVTATQPIGVDIEKIDTFSRVLRERIADDGEWHLLKEVTPLSLYTLWTAKEAVLKAETIGLEGLGDCRIVAKQAEDRLQVKYRSNNWTVRYKEVPHGYIAAVTDIGLPVIWYCLPISGYKQTIPAYSPPASLSFSKKW